MRVHIKDLKQRIFVWLGERKREKKTRHSYLAHALRRPCTFWGVKVTRFGPSTVNGKRGAVLEQKASNDRYSNEARCSREEVL